MREILQSFIDRFFTEPPNRISHESGPFFEPALIGVAAATDPIWLDFKEVVGVFHLTPAEMVAHCCPDDSWQSRSVISWVLPISERTRETNRRQELWPCKEWVLTANRGNDLLLQLKAHLAAFLTARGHRAVAPQPVTIREPIDGVEVAVASTWSERHVAYAAGLGTFGLNGGLITSRGIAHRCGSLITDAVLAPSPRPSSDAYGYCLHRREGTCGACIERCPSGALSTAGIDKAKCRHRIYGEAPPVLMARYGLTADQCKTGSCGLCQTKVPCEAGIP
ncbi:epoxyqueuosine reductase [Geomesophilobacter sediminis]|uniref:Epoxyqueuosine reductase n=1 Tax=Geomesophilobacter sediminis TaxID=2798584 RepID=A0A8J7JJ38_9BACT|nr:epoxyqueuosine reductase [Geomesophilobacter sediminis]MBJ6724515.1 epoxyqueuosine reductase [Geomesophilobacter sediminis]